MVISKYTNQIVQSRGTTGKGSSSFKSVSLGDNVEFIVSIPEFDHFDNSSTVSINNWINILNNSDATSVFDLPPDYTDDDIIYRMPISDNSDIIEVRMGIVKHIYNSVKYYFFGFNVYKNNEFVASVPSLDKTTPLLFEGNDMTPLIVEGGNVLYSIIATDLGSQNANIGYRCACYHKFLMDILVGTSSNTNKTIGYFRSNTADANQVATQGTFYVREFDNEFVENEQIRQLAMIDMNAEDIGDIKDDLTSIGYRLNKAQESYVSR